MGHSSHHSYLGFEIDVITPRFSRHPEPEETGVMERINGCRTQRPQPFTVCGGCVKQWRDPRNSFKQGCAVRDGCVWRMHERAVLRLVPVL